MSSFSTPAIMLRRIDYNDYDLIINFFTLAGGKISVIAKSAKKSTKRFSGILELFSVLDIVYTSGRRKGLPILKEAALKQPFSKIRTDIKKTAYASYWAELINVWMEEGERQIQLYYLFYHVLDELNIGRISEEALSILFQMRFMIMSGLSPNLIHCSMCKIEIEGMKKNRIMFDLAKGGIVCERCTSGSLRKVFLSKGTIKQLLWFEKEDLKTAKRVRLTPQAIKESIDFLEAFVPYHTGKKLRSLKFLRQIRQKRLE